MSSKNQDPEEPTFDDEEVGSSYIKETKALSNNELIPDAGKVKLDKAQGCGRGVVKDVKSTVGTWWLKVS